MTEINEITILDIAYVQKTREKLWHLKKTLSRVRANNPRI